MFKATAVAHSNIALIKYWGRKQGRDPALNIPANDNISITKNSIDDTIKLSTTTTIAFANEFKNDSATVNKKLLSDRNLQRITRVVDALRDIAQTSIPFNMVSMNDYPTQAGLASSASAFAALTLAAAHALDLKLSRGQLSRIARLGSGSAARSLHDGFVFLHSGDNHVDSFAEQIFEPQQVDLRAVIVIVSKSPKKITSDAGHEIARSSPFDALRIENTRQQLIKLKQAMLKNDFQLIGAIAEANCLQMHAVMMTSDPPLIYWLPETLRVINKVHQMRAGGLEVYFTIDAGPNVHCLCRSRDLEKVTDQLRSLEGVKRTIKVKPGRGAYLVNRHLF